MILPVLLALSLHAQNAPLPFHGGELVFTPGSAPFAECHASTLVALSDGDLLAAWFGGTGEGAPDVAIYTARLHAGHWTAPAALVREPGTPTWNPVLFHTLPGPGPDAGRLWLYLKAGPEPSGWSGLRLSSNDEGRSWTAPELLPAGLLGPVRAKPLVLPDGTVIAGTSVEAWHSWAAWIERSSDSGATWQTIGPLTISPALDRATPPLPRQRPAHPALASPRRARERPSG